MYKIYVENRFLGYTETPWYIKKSENGSFVACKPVEAQGISFKGKVYSLPGHTEIDGPEAVASMVTDYEFVELLNRQHAAVTLATKQAKTFTDDDQRLEVSALYDDWAPGKYEVGDIYNTHEGGELGSSWEQTWEVFQAYDNIEFPDIKPGDPSWHTFNRPLHGKSPETARPWVKPEHGTTDVYKVGEYMIWTDGKIYTPTRDTNYSPEEYAPDWKVYGESSEEETSPVLSGSKESPFIAEAGSPYIYGKYYLDPEDNEIYLCFRKGETDGSTVTLYYLPHELVGQYFEKA